MSKKDMAITINFFIKAGPPPELDEINMVLAIRQCGSHHDSPVFVAQTTKTTASPGGSWQCIEL
jgi:hypothetical protein